MTIVMGIETSCDETGVGFVQDGVLLGDALASSMDEHARFGGVVPEIASRHHLELVNAVVDDALQQAEATLDDIDLVAFTQGPGLVGALLIQTLTTTIYSIGVPPETTLLFKALVVTLVCLVQSPAFRAKLMQPRRRRVSTRDRPPPGAQPPERAVDVPA